MVTRLLYLAVVISSAWLLGIGMYAQHARGLKACGPLILTRYALVLAALFAIFAIIVNAGRPIRWVLSLLIALGSTLGVWISAYQSWPGYVPTPARFGIQADILAPSLPLADVLPRFFLGAANCEAFRWKFLGVALPQWYAAFFAGFVVLALIAARRD